jgi:isoleucyl-tRNA synthetase
MFRPVTSRVEFARIEEEILRFWRKNDIFRRSIDARKDGPRFVLYEGPPTANGSPGIHHVLSRIFKDIIPRYKAMKGYYTPRIAGWDTHGLPVELEVEKELGLATKADIENYGIDRFNAKCRESVFRYLEEWNAMTERIAFWLDLEHPYITMDNTYIESCWWAIKQMWDKGLVYQGHRVTPHCPRCGTSLSSHEVALGYQEHIEDPSVYIKFKVAQSLYSSPGFLRELRSGYGDRVADFAKWLLGLAGDKEIYLLAWTTTPWTLPGNTALAVAADAEYALVEHGEEYLILADALRERVGLGDNKVVDKVKGSDLVDLRYEPLFNPFDFAIPVARMDVLKKSGEPSSDIIWKKGGILNYPVIEGDFVSMEEGTGMVHIAPAYGEVDYEAGLKNALDFVHTVDLQGNITGNYPFSGKFVKDADEDIIADLKAWGLLFRSEKIHHTYPFCWRCGTPLLYYAKQSWYIRTTAVKDRMITGNREIHWYPEHIKQGRFGDWLENNVDWAFSRERYWGTPLPVWRCQSCGNHECIGGMNELEAKPGFSSFEEPLDLHRPYVDRLSYDCLKCRGQMVRVTEVIDCWFDSGAMPIAQWHYPFDNETLLSDGRFPADFVSEAVDQTRGWFYSLHAISMLLFDRPSYKNVICLGHILDARGDKMSKAKGNVVELWPIINKYGADALRWYLFTATPPGNARRFSEQLVSEVTRQFLLTLWNVYSFFVTYANIDRFNPAMVSDRPEPSVLDRWIISELNQLVLAVDDALGNYHPTEAGRKIEGFVSDLSNWYVRRSRRRFWKSESDADKLAAYTTLYQCLVTLVKLLAPFTPLLAEALYQNLVGSVYPEAQDSVHLTDFPLADKGKIDEQLSSDARLAMKLSSLGRAARSQAGIKVRQPLSGALVILASALEKPSLGRVEHQVLEELNVKGIELVTNAEDLERLGYMLNAEGGYGVAIPTEISPELAAEGLAREIVHRLQTMRRQAKFNIADYIITYYQADDYVHQVFADFGDYIKRETLSRQLSTEVPAEGVYSEKYRLVGHDLLLAVARLD